MIFCTRSHHPLFQHLRLDDWMRNVVLLIMLCFTLKWSERRGTCYSPNFNLPPVTASPDRKLRRKVMWQVSVVFLRSTIHAVCWYCQMNRLSRKTRFASVKLIEKRNWKIMTLYIHSFFQIPGKMAGCGVQWGNLVVLSGSKLFVERIAFDDALWTNTSAVLKSFPCITIVLNSFILDLVQNDFLFHSSESEVAELLPISNRTENASQTFNSSLPFSLFLWIWFTHLPYMSLSGATAPFPS